MSSLLSLAYPRFELTSSFAPFKRPDPCTHAFSILNSVHIAAGSSVSYSAVIFTNGSRPYTSEVSSPPFSSSNGRLFDMRPAARRRFAAAPVYIIRMGGQAGSHRASSHRTHKSMYQYVGLARSAEDSILQEWLTSVYDIQARPQCEVCSAKLEGSERSTMSEVLQQRFSKTIFPRPSNISSSTSHSQLFRCALGRLHSTVLWG
ncbi:hypothetical protein C8Q79DRAFT_357699 [Trametes meyenii]|nr:hypothetical protein C8Q79DRAFT_357699 [Trametes meyenii]